MPLQTNIVVNQDDHPGLHNQVNAVVNTLETKLNGIQDGATANDTNANLRNRGNHTGTQSADTIVDGTNNKVFTSAEKTKLAGIEAGATSGGTGGSGGTAATSEYSVKVGLTANTTVATGTSKILVWDTEEFDIGNLHNISTNGSRIVATIAGRYTITASVSFTSNATGTRHVYFNKNGSSVEIGSEIRPAVNGFATRMTATATVDLAANDYLEVGVYQTSGSTLTIESAYTNSSVFKIGGVKGDTGSTSVVYGTVQGTAAQGNDSRLSDTRTPTDGSVTNAKVSTSAAISADKLADGSSKVVMTTAERTKLAGIETGATAGGTSGSATVTSASIVAAYGTLRLFYNTGTGKYPARPSVADGYVDFYGPVEPTAANSASGNGWSTNDGWVDTTA